MPESAAASLGLTEAGWSSFVDRVEAGYVVPIVGSRLLAPPLPSREDVAERWARDAAFPLAGTTNLPLVAQYVERDAVDPEAFFSSAQQVVTSLGSGGVDDLGPSHPLRLLAELPFDLYITTSYDELLADAIAMFRPGGATPKRISCLWNPDERLYEEDEVTAHYDDEPSPSEPFVLHLLGRRGDPASLVMTELHHMQFTKRLIATPKEARGETSVMPTKALRALATRSWLFLGFSAADLNFRMLLRAFGDLVSTSANRRRQVVAVQLLKEDAVPGREKEADDFLSWYFGRLLDRAESEVEVVFTPVAPFLATLREEIGRRIGAPT